jgi:hypothetical protein
MSPENCPKVRFFCVASNFFSNRLTVHHNELQRFHLLVNKVFKLVLQSKFDNLRTNPFLSALTLRFPAAALQIRNFYRKVTEHIYYSSIEIQELNLSKNKLNGKNWE